MMNFGRYELLEPLAAGGMGEVYRARLIGVAGFKKQLALKRIYPHLSVEERYRELFVREAKIVADLQHPNIVQVMDLGIEQGDLFLAMEFIEGGDVSRLARSVSSRRLPPNIVALIAFDVLEALDYAHTKADDRGRPLGVVHRDVSPQNILVDAHTGFAKLCDFGIAFSAREVTVSGDIRGKAGFIAPEQARQEEIDARADIFALGAVMFELLSGRPLFEGGSISEALGAIRDGDIPPVAPRLTHVAPGLLAIVEKALAWDRNDRFQSAAEFRAALEEILLHADPRAVRGELKVLAQSVAHARRGNVELKPDSDTSLNMEEAKGWTRLVTRASAEVNKSTEELSEPVISAPRTRKPARNGLVIALSTALMVVGAVAGIAMLARDEGISAPAAQPATPPPVPTPVPAADEDAIADNGAHLTPGEPTAAPASAPSKRRAREPESGFLTVNAAPWARVAIDGKALTQTTPIVEHKLPAGKHTLTLTSPSGKVSTLTVTVRPHQTTTRFIDLRNE